MFYNLSLEANNIRVNSPQLIYFGNYFTKSPKFHTEFMQNTQMICGIFGNQTSQFIFGQLILKME